jgi:hypothetical protein
MTDASQKNPGSAGPSGSADGPRDLEPRRDSGDAVKYGDWRMVARRSPAARQAQLRVPRS